MTPTQLTALVAFIRNEQPVSTLDLTGRRFGRLLVLSRAGVRGKAPTWNCVCDCGTECVKIGHLMKAGRTRSCGCYRREKIRKANHIHGLSHMPEHEIWQSMIRRCDDHANPNYGGRGISVCERWRESFEAFIADMGPRPSSRHSIERIDNEASYSPGNCIWATSTVQARNKRNTKYIDFRGVTRCLAEWAEATGIKMYVLSRRLKSGWSVERALTEPLHVAKRHYKPEANRA